MASQPTFLGHPLELRDEIYKYAFESTDVEITSEGYASHDLVGFMTASKQLHAETIKLYYKHVNFRFRDPLDGAGWFAALPRRYVELIPEIRLEMEYKGNPSEDEFSELQDRQVEYFCEEAWIRGFRTLDEVVKVVGRKLPNGDDIRYHWTETPMFRD